MSNLSRRWKDNHARHVQKNSAMWIFQNLMVCNCICLLKQSISWQKCNAWHFISLFFLRFKIYKKKTDTFSKVEMKVWLTCAGTNKSTWRKHWTLKCNHMMQGVGIGSQQCETNILLEAVLLVVLYVCFFNLKHSVMNNYTDFITLLSTKSR